MINLIPKPAKNKILREYWVRVISIWLLLLASVATIIALLLIPTYVLLQGKIAAYKEGAEEAIAQADEYNTSAASLVAASKQALSIIKQNEQITFTETINFFSNLTNEGVVITAYELTRTDGVMNAVIINGTANTRQALANFREILINHPRIEKIELPISNLVLDRDIEFSITITMKPAE